MQKAIVLNGLARGGTNVTWNIIQSHPNVVSPMCEINEAIGIRSKQHFQYSLMTWMSQMNVFSDFAHKRVKKLFQGRKKLTLLDSDNQFKTMNERYSEAEVENATLCLKGVCSPELWDLRYSGLLNGAFDQSHFVYLVRHGHSLCESWVRRGISPQKAGYYYARFVEEILVQKEKFKSSTIVRFEDVIQRPFDVAQHIFDRAEEPPVNLKYLRLKSKRTLNDDGKHQVNFGKLGRKYWFDVDNIHNLLQKNIEQIHREQLSKSQIKAFNLEASKALTHFNYQF